MGFGKTSVYYIRLINELHKIQALSEEIILKQHEYAVSKLV